MTRLGSIIRIASDITVVTTLLLGSNTIIWTGMIGGVLGITTSAIENSFSKQFMSMPYIIKTLVDGSAMTINGIIKGVGADMLYQTFSKPIIGYFIGDIVDSITTKVTTPANILSSTCTDTIKGRVAAVVGVVITNIAENTYVFGNPSIYTENNHDNHSSDTEQFTGMYTMQVEI